MKTCDQLIRTDSVLISYFIHSLRLFKHQCFLFAILGAWCMKRRLLLNVEDSCNLWLLMVATKGFLWSSDWPGNAVYIQTKEGNSVSICLFFN